MSLRSSDKENLPSVKIEQKFPIRYQKISKVRIALSYSNLEKAGMDSNFFDEFQKKHSKLSESKFFNFQLHLWRDLHIVTEFQISSFNLFCWMGLKKKILRTFCTFLFKFNAELPQKAIAIKKPPHQNFHTTFKSPIRREKPKRSQDAWFSYAKKSLSIFTSLENEEFFV